MNSIEKVVFYTLTLCLIGIVFIYSSSAIYMWQTTGSELNLVMKQVIAIFIGFVIFYFITGVDSNFIKKLIPYIYFFSILCLIAVYIPGLGKRLNNANRWLDLGLVYFQPSELAKFITPIFLAWLISYRKIRLGHFFSSVAYLLIILLPAVLILKGPDVGGAMFLLVISFGTLVLIVSKQTIKYMFPFIIPLIFLAIVFSYKKFDHIRERLKGYLNPKEYSLSVNYQRNQALISIGSGGLFGNGLGKSTQKLFFLPDAYSDFILPVIVEETGLFGLFIILLLYFLLIKELFFISYTFSLSKERYFEKTVSAIVPSIILIQVALNVSVVNGWLPTKGLPLPLISYGGTSILVNITFISLVLNFYGEGLMQRKDNVLKVNDNSNF